MTPPNLVGALSPAMLVPLTARSMISGIAKSPTVTAMSEMPSQRNNALSSPNSPSRVKRGTLSIGSRPTIASTRPRPPATRPLGTFSPLRDATKVMPRSASMKNSAEPIESTSGADDWNRQRQHEGAEHRADQRAHERRAERASGFTVLRHRMTVDNGRGGDPFAGNTEQHRGYVSRSSRSRRWSPGGRQTP